MLKEDFHSWIRHLAQDDRPVCEVGEEPGQVPEGGRGWVLDKRVEAVPENILHTGTYGKGFRPELLENSHHVIDDQAIELPAWRVEQVERDRSVGILRVEIDYVAGAGARDMVVENVVDKLAVGINDGNAVTGCNVPRDHISHEGAFAGAGCAEDRQMLTPSLG